MKARGCGNYVYVAPGDVVTLKKDYPFFLSLPKGELKVVAVKYRYGTVGGGNIRQAPLLTLENLETGETRHLDNSFIDQVVRREPVPVGLPLNIFRDEMKCHKEIPLFRTGEKGIWCGPLVTLVRAVLATLPLRFLQDIDPKKVLALYEKQRRGLVRKDRWAFLVHIKPFRRWVQQNANRVLKTAAQLHKEKTKFNRTLEADYWAGCEEELSLGSLETDFEQQ